MPRGFGLIVRVATCCVAVAWFAACGGGGSGKAPAGYSEECELDEDCEQGLLCVGAPSGLCTIPCTSSAACQAESATGVCTEAHCYDACTPQTQACPNPRLKCTMSTTAQGTCRVP